MSGKTGNRDRRGSTTQGKRRALYTPRDTDVRDYPKNVFEYAAYWAFGDPDHKWGPFARHVRAAKKEGRWREWKLRDIVNEEPEDSGDESDTPYRRRSRSARRNNQHRYRIADELRNDVRPARIDFEELLGRISHPGDYDDAFYQKHYANLYTKTVEFAAKWFDGNVNLDSFSHPGQIWTANLTEQFKEYARLVAHEDRGNGGWPVILNDATQRRWLVVGILGQVMEKKVFNELLFGADEDTEEELERLDLKWMEKEGYGRKTARAITARYGVEGGLLPADFWPKVDELTAKTMKIFLPLLNVFKEVFPPPTRTWYSRTVFLQELHTIISYAGMIQVCMAISPSIFHFLSATPGARMDYGQEQQADMQLYRESKELYDAEDTTWREHVNAAVTGSRVSRHAGQPIQIPQNENERRAMEYHRLRGARVKFAVFPKVTRYRAYNKGRGTSDDILHYDPEDESWQNERDTIEGQSIMDISHCMVVYYQGLMYPEESYVEAITLDEHLNTLLWQPNGLYGILATGFSALFSASRRAFWHVFVVGGVLWSLFSIYKGFDYITYLLNYWFTPLLWISCCTYFLAKPHIDQGNWKTGGSIIGAWVLFLYLIGAYYTYTGAQPPPRDARVGWEFLGGQFNETFSDRIRGLLKPNDA
ncbi:uncharacterized protein F4812DRAFT_443346 [Daldinia caldariorum]|uniref:uncharacterized protein n=1 Tax=Daldinia caldariorum TaxID=326644 RepID=UPI0020085897|nr:uncharacterized protein F4812DRAFT_443346 [Daldinia caldariorum]KAI1464415.1 hypothetical protein F4812DRAFT_443346 [Daldinia caldariorum]